MVAVFATVVFAAGLDAPQIGSVDSGALTVDPAALFFAPTLLARMERTTILAGVEGVVGRASYRWEQLGAYGFADDFSTARTKVMRLDCCDLGFACRECWVAMGLDGKSP